MHTVSPDLYRDEPQPDGVCGCGCDTYPRRGRAHFCGACQSHVAPVGACPDCGWAASRCTCDAERTHAGAYVAGAFGAMPETVTDAMRAERAASGHPYLLTAL